MHCSRCHGLMVRDHFLDFEGTTGHMWATGYRCMNCGHVHDPVIEQRRLAQLQQAAALRTAEPDYQDDEVHLGMESFIARAA
ncbi:MAG TPA: hypothetical protein VD738_08630 [Nitrospira sp.]|nr:hypothetical protein [Nitrospira sp.]